MHYSLEMLTRGNSKVIEHYKSAADRWKEIWARPESHKLAPFAKLLTTEQSWFEDHCGGRWVGQEVMVVSGIAGLYTTFSGFDDKLPQALLLYDAFLSSYCSVEVKSIAEEVAQSYGLLDTSRV